MASRARACAFWVSVAEMMGQVAKRRMTPYSFLRTGAILHILVETASTLPRQSSEKEIDETGSTGRALPGCRGDGDVRPDPVPGALRGDRPGDSADRPRSAHQPAGDEPGIGHGQRRVRRGDGDGRLLRPAAAPAANHARLRLASGHRIGPRS